MFTKEEVIGHSWLLKRGDSNNTYGSLQIRIKKTSFFGLRVRRYTLDLVKDVSDGSWFNSETAEKVPPVKVGYKQASLYTTARQHQCISSLSSWLQRYMTLQK